MTATLQELAADNTDVVVDGTSRQDEIGAMARAAEALKHTCVAAARTGCGLDNHRANAMIADEQNTNIYCNRSVIEPLKKAEADIRRARTDFNARAKGGRHGDVLHK